MTAWRTVATMAVCPGEFLERVVFLESDPYERLKNMATQARANRSQFLEHLILRAEAIDNFQPPLPADAFIPTLLCRAPPVWFGLTSGSAATLGSAVRY